MRLLLASLLAVAAVVAVALWRVPHASRATTPAPSPQRIGLPPDAADAADLCPPTAARLFGRVLEDETDEPIAGAHVIAYAFGTGRFLEATTAGDGSFEIPEAAAAGDAFELVVRHERFGAAHVRAVAPRDATVVRLPEPSRLRGRVVAMDARSPVAACRVTAMRSLGPRRRHESRIDELLPAALVTDAATTTNADGTFEIAGLAPGTYRLIAEAEGFPPSEGNVIETRHPRECEIALLPTAEVLVDLFDVESGAPLDGARFEMDFLSGQARLPIGARECGSGTYALRAGLWRGSIEMMCIRVGRDGYASRDVLLCRLDRGADFFLLAPGERFPLALGRGAAIFGHVRSSGQPEPGAILVVEAASSCVVWTGTTGPDGAFAVSGIDAGAPVTVHVYDRALRPVTAVSLRLRHGEQRMVEINEPGTTAIEGRIVLGGAPASDAEVTLSGSTQATSATGPDGRYRIEGLNGGPHEMQVWVPDGRVTRHVSVEEGRCARLDVTASCTISGVVVDARTGLPVLAPHFGVEAERSGSEDRATAFGGRFRLHVDRGLHRIDCLSENVYAVEPPVVEARSGDSEIVLRVLRGSCAVTLDVRDGRTNESVPRCVYEYAWGDLRYGPRHACGEIMVGELRPGVHRLRVWSEAHAPAEVELILDEARPQVRLTVALPRADAVRIAEVMRDTEAARAGLRVGDRILSWNGVATPSVAEYNAAREGGAGAARIEYERDGKRGFLDVPAGEACLALENILLDR